MTGWPAADVTSQRAEYDSTDEASEPVTRDLAQRAGTAVVWRGLSLVGEKLIFLLRLVILARILLPEDFGLVAIGMAALVLMSSLTDLGVVSALVQDPSRDRQHLDTAWTIGVIRGLFVCLVLLFGAPYIAAAFGEPAARPFVQAIGVTVLLRSVASIRIAHLNRELHFRSLAIIGLATASINTVVAVVLAPHLGAWALIWGSIAGALTFFAGSFIAAPYAPRLRLDLSAAGSIMRFGKWIFLIGIIAVLGDTLLRLIITRQLGIAELGLYFLAARLGYLPAQLISEIVGNVAFPVYARVQDDNLKATNMFRRVLVATTALMIPACAVFACLVPALVSDLLGERWQGTVGVMQLLILSSVAGILGDSVAPLLKGMGRPARILWMDSVQLVVLLGAAWLLIDLVGLWGAGMAWVISVVSSQFMAYRYATDALDDPFRGVGAVMVAIIVTGVVAALIAAVILHWMSGILAILLAVVASAAAAVLAILVLDRQFGLGLRRSLSEPFPWARRLGVLWETEN